MPGVEEEEEVAAGMEGVAGIAVGDTAVRVTVAAATVSAAVTQAVEVTAAVTIRAGRRPGRPAAIRLPLLVLATDLVWGDCRPGAYAG